MRGAVAQGIGGALLERVVYDDNGQPQASSLMDYLLPTAMDVPMIEVEHCISPSPFTPGGIKGMGEPGLIATPAAVANAVADALAPFSSVDTAAVDTGARLEPSEPLTTPKARLPCTRSRPWSLRCGPQREKSRFTYMHNFGDKVDIPYVSWLIQGEGRNILVDAGCSAEDYRTQDPGRLAADARR